MKEEEEEENPPWMPTWSVVLHMCSTKTDDPHRRLHVCLTWLANSSSAPTYRLMRSDVALIENELGK